jgi:hypothetical protein
LADKEISKANEGCYGEVTFRLERRHAGDFFGLRGKKKTWISPVINKKSKRFEGFFGEKRKLNGALRRSA